MNMLTVRDIDLNSKKVIMRVDFNVPVKNGKITDDTRITAALPTIKYAIDHNAKVILLSHLGRPKNGPDQEFSLKPVAERLNELMPSLVSFVEDTRGESVNKAVENLQQGHILLIENTRFEKGEEKNDTDLAKYWAGLADIHINDAFGTAHRAHSSNVGIASYIPSVAGFLMEKEIKFLSKVTYEPEHPYVVVLGGAKVSDKINVINHLLEKADKILIGGAMMFTFLKAQGKNIGSSRYEADKVDFARELLEKAASKNVEIVLPVDSTVAKKLEAGTENRLVSIDDGIEEGWMGLDIGPETIKLFSEKLSGARTIIWNGPMGVFEIPDFSYGTKEIAKRISSMTTKETITVVGGGDSAAAAEEFGMAQMFSHVSTGGGASLEYLEGITLPGIASISQKKNLGIRKFILAGNWKMNKTPSQAAEFACTIVPKLQEFKKITSVLCVPFTALERVSEYVDRTHVFTGAQNMYHESSGAFTGEVSACMLKDISVDYVILGHSERRHIFHEGDELINQKVLKALDEGLIPILCVGEQLQDREDTLTFNIIELQVKKGLKNVSANDLQKVVIAYEPVWAIGTGKVASPEQAQQVHEFIRELIAELYSRQAADGITILYGGSVSESNYLGLFLKKDIDGGLVGGASLKQSFINLASIMDSLIE